MTTENNVLKLITSAEKYFGKEYNDEQVKTLLREMVKHQENLVQFAFDSARRRSPYLPQLSNLLEIIDSYESANVSRSLDGEVLHSPCVKCNGFGILQIWGIFEHFKRVPNSPEWVWPGNEYHEPPDQDAVRMVARCGCENGKIYGALPIYKSKERS
jgi:hypothetical protein